MDRQIVVAQANNSQSTAGAANVITVTKPQGEQAITIYLDGSTKLDLSAIANDQITLVHVGDRLIILFDNHAQVTVEPFFNDSGQPAADLTVELGPGHDVTAAQFAGQFPITDDPSVLPASGGPGAPSSGANFVGFTLDTLSTPTPLDLLTAETFGSTSGTIDQSPNLSQITPMSLSGAKISGATDEGGMIVETIGEGITGNDHGAAFSATGVAGSLNALVNFGTGGPAATPFQFVDTAAANTWLANLGLESHGSLIDTATITGNTVVASTDPAQGTPHDVFSLTLNADGSWVFTLLAPFDHPAGLGENSLPIDLSGLIQAVSAAGGHLTLSNDFTITVVDDVPQLDAEGVVSISVHEAGLAPSFEEGPPGDLFGTGNDLNALAVVGGTLAGVVHFGADGPVSGTVQDDVESRQAPDGFKFNIAPGTHTDDLGITSHGDKVDVLTVSDDGITQTLTAWATDADGNLTHEAFSLVLVGDGSYTFTLINPIDHPAGDGDNTESGVVSFDLSTLITATDFDGDSITLSGDFKITVVDDQPALVSGASASTGVVDESALNKGTPGDIFGSGSDNGDNPVTAIGSLAAVVSFGADGPAVGGGFRLVDSDTAIAWLKQLGLMSHDDVQNNGGVDQFVDIAVVSGNTLQAWTTGGPDGGGHEVFTLTLNGDGTYTFTLVNPLDDPQPGHGNPGQAVADSVTIDLSGFVEAVDYDNDVLVLSNGALPSAASDFTITVDDDVPELVSGAVVSSKIDEGALQAAFASGTDTWGSGNDTNNEGASVTASGSGGQQSGSLKTLVHFGADGPAGTDFKIATVADARTWLQALDLSSHGVAVDKVSISVEKLPDNTGISTLTASTDDGHAVFTLTVHPDGSWELTLLEPIDHTGQTYSGTGPEPTTILDLSGFVRAVDFDGDAISLASGTSPSSGSDFSVTITDDVPSLIPGASASAETVDEGALKFAAQGSGPKGDFFGDGNDQGHATVTFSGSLSDLVSFGADGAPSTGTGFRLVDAATASAWLQSLNLSSHGTSIDLAVFSGGTLQAWTGAGPGANHPGAHLVFTLVLNGNGIYTFTLVNPIDDPNPGHGTPGQAVEDSVTLDLSGLIQAVDGDGDAVSLSSGTPSPTSDFHITVVDDVPVASQVIVGIEPADHSASLTLVSGTNFSFGADGGSSVTFDTAHAVITGPDGVSFGTPTFVVNGNTLELDPGTAFNGLAAGQLATVDVKYTVTDFDGDSATSDVVFTVQGVAAPTITAPDLNIAVNVPAGSTADPHADAGHFSIPVLSLLGLDSDSQGLPLSVQVIAFGNTPGEGLGVTNGVPDGNYIQLPYGAVGTSETFTMLVTDSAGVQAFQNGTITFANFSTALTNSGAAVDASNGFNFLIDNTGVWMDTLTGNAVLLENGVANVEIGAGPVGGGNDFLVGTELGNDVLFAGPGNDTLWGRSGVDTLNGNLVAGNTTFYYANPDEGGHSGNVSGDTINNFDSLSGQHDVIAISASGFNAGSPFANLTVGEDVSNIFSTGAPTAAMSNTRFFTDGAGTLSYSYDGTSTHLVTLAHVTNHNVTAADIHVVA